MKLVELLTLVKDNSVMQVKQKPHRIALTQMTYIQNDEDLYHFPVNNAVIMRMGEHYLLHASEAMLTPLIAEHPYIAGWYAVVANICTITAIGGRVNCLINSYWHTDTTHAQLLLQGIRDACAMYGVEPSGQHIHLLAQLQPALIVEMVGVAKQLLSVFHVRAGQKIIIALDLNGKFHSNTNYWKCFEQVSASTLQAQMEILPQIAERYFAHAALNIGHTGILGALLMLLEATGSGANIDLSKIPKVQQIDWLQWLQLIPSYGFLLTADKDEYEEIHELFASQDIACAVIGEVTNFSQVVVQLNEEYAIFWDFQQQAIMGTNYREPIQQQCDRGRSLIKQEQPAMKHKICQA